MIITHTTTKEFDVYMIGIKSTAFIWSEHFATIRKRQHEEQPSSCNCWECGKDFEMCEQLSLVFIRGQLNELICASCTSDYILRGIPITVFSKPT